MEEFLGKLRLSAAQTTGANTARMFRFQVVCGGPRHFPGQGLPGTEGQNRGSILNGGTAEPINIWLIYDLFSKYTSQIVIYYLMLRIRLALAVKLNQL